MNPTFLETGRLYSLTDAKAIASEVLRHWSDQADSVFKARGAAGYHQIRIPIEATHLSSWLSRQHLECNVYWSARDQSEEYAGCGKADFLQIGSLCELELIFDKLNESLEKSARGLRYFGGFRFCDQKREDDAWEEFGENWFALSRAGIVRSDNEHRFFFTFSEDERINQLDDLLLSLDAIEVAHGPSHDPLSMSFFRCDEPGLSGWIQNVCNALCSFEEGSMDKIVLARRTTLSFQNDVAPLDLLDRLGQATPECYHFCFTPNDAVSFIGASPERLFRRQARFMETESVAGTRPRGRTVEEDRRLSENLLASGKDLREHFFVRDSIRDTMEPICDTLHVDKKVSVLKLARGQHLFTRFEGALKPDVTDAGLISSLHPTPAVGGCPTQVAVDRIVEMEPFDRGWYAAPVGWVSEDASEFAVAIRSGLLRRNQLALFSGAGIVQGSIPEQEWDEIENKISDFIKVLTA